MTIVHMLWVRGSLGILERLSINSFVANGYEVKLWTYGNLKNIPRGVEVCCAGDVVKESEIFYNSFKQLAGFSDLFRYAVLTRFGGLWVDTDVVALKPAMQCPTFPFVVNDRNKDGSEKINGNVIHHPKPEANDIIDMMYLYASHFPKHKVHHLELAVYLLNAMFSIYPDHGFKVMRAEFANPLNYWESPQVFLRENPVPDAQFLHLYTSVWWGADGMEAIKRGVFPQNSLIGKLAELYGT